MVQYKITEVRKYNRIYNKNMIILIYSFPCSVSVYYIFRFSLSNVIAGETN